jgi:hypothetical protein
VSRQLICFWLVVAQAVAQLDQPQAHTRHQAAVAVAA